MMVSTDKPSTRSAMQWLRSLCYRRMTPPNIAHTMTATLKRSEHNTPAFMHQLTELCNSKPNLMSPRIALMPAEYTRAAGASAGQTAYGPFRVGISHVSRQRGRRTAGYCGTASNALGPFIQRHLHIRRQGAHGRRSFDCGAKRRRQRRVKS